MIVTGPVLVLAALVVVPLGLTLLAPALGSAAQRLPLLALLPGALASLSLVLEPGITAAGLAVPWLLFAAATALLALRALWTTRTLDALGRLGATGGLVMGAGWLVIDRLGATEWYGETITRLTAVHFHYAGFAAALIATFVWRTAHRKAPRAALLMLLLVLGGPWITALGFTVHPIFQTIGAAVVATGLVLAALLTLRHAAPVARAAGAAAAALLLTLSSVAVLAPMLLAVQWAVGVNYGTPTLSLDVMALTHGLLNALGFSLLGLLGWKGFPDISHRR